MWCNSFWLDRYPTLWLLNAEDPLQLYFLLAQWAIITILSKWCKPDNFEPHNSLKVSFTNVWGLCFNFVECESFRESKSPDILALCETKSGWLNWFSQFLCEGLSSFNLKWFCYSCMILQFMWRRTPFCTGLISRKFCGFFFRFRLALLHSVS